jgi:hypothetical protein
MVNMTMTAGNSIKTQAYFDGMVGPQVVFRYLPYGAGKINSVIKTGTEMRI